MREIKFRGKRVDNGKWVYGYFAIDTDTKSNYIIERIYWNCEECSDQTLYYEVDPETIGQYTGLKDKNDKELYEGDAIKDPDGNVLEVVWNKGAASFELQNNISHFLFVQRYIDMFEVIGNIHDNPDLLEDDQ